jgi:ACS family pantothenate transporter-like MFS transporter
MTGVVNFSTFKEIIKHWRFWVLVPTYLFYAWSVQAYQYFAIYVSRPPLPRQKKTAKVLC